MQRPAKIAALWLPESTSSLDHIQQAASQILRAIEAGG
jgi:hypothetical protein